MLPRPGTNSEVPAILLRHSDSPPTGTWLYLPKPLLYQLSISELFQNCSLVNPTWAHSSPRSHDKLRNSPLLVLSSDIDIQSLCDSHIQEVKGLGKNKIPFHVATVRGGQTTLRALLSSHRRHPPKIRHPNQTIAAGNRTMSDRYHRSRLSAKLIHWKDFKFDTSVI
jgi:hypothetical protein